jgi:hypothetical protein
MDFAFIDPPLFDFMVYARIPCHAPENLPDGAGDDNIRAAGRRG